MKDLFILVGSTFEDGLDDSIRERYYKKPLQLANVYYERTLLKGFKEDGLDARFVSAPEVGTYPFSCRQARVRNKDFPSDDFNVVSYSAFVGAKHFSKATALKKKLMCEVKRLKGNYSRVVLVLCEAYWPYLSAAYAVKKKLGVDVISIVPDLPRHVVASSSLLHKAYVKASNSLIRKIPDGYVLFSETMLGEPYIDKAKPHLISEGILPTKIAIAPKLGKTKEKVIVYAGTVSFANGIDLLLQAYSSLNDPSVKLLIAGVGDAVEHAESHSLKGVELLGLLSKKEVDALMEKADLLVSPRIPDEYCSYSFPSKVVNCLAYRIPLVSFKLPCYSKDMADVICYPEQVSAEALAEAMKRCLSGEWTPNEETRDSILDRLSSVKLAGGIADLIRR